MSDGIILRQWRNGGRLERPTLATRKYSGRPQEARANLKARFEARR